MTYIDIYFPQHEETIVPQTDCFFFLNMFFQDSLIHESSIDRRWLDISWH